jgi:hypothetical protein
MLRKEMDERIKTYDVKPVEKPSLKFDLKTDLLGKSDTVSELKPILKQPQPIPERKQPEEPEQNPKVTKSEAGEAVKEEEPLKRFNKYLEEEDDYTSSSSESDYSESEHSEDEEDIYKQYKNKVNKIDEKINFRKAEKTDDNKVKKDIDHRKGATSPKDWNKAGESVKEDDRKDERKKDDTRKILDDYKRRDDDLDDRRRRDDLDDRRRRDDLDDRRRRDDLDDRRRDDRDDRRRDDRDDRRRDDRDDRRRDDRDDRRRDDRDDRRRDDIKSEPKVLKGNQFIDIPKKHILQIIKSKDVDSISADCVDEMKDILQDFTTHMFELFSDGDKVVIAERDDVKSYIALFIEDEDKEMVDELILTSKDIERAVMNIAEAYNVKIKKDVVYIVHTFLESILVKVITGAKMINELARTKRVSGKELRTAYKIYML